MSMHTYGICDLCSTRLDKRCVGTFIMHPGGPDGYFIETSLGLPAKYPVQMSVTVKLRLHLPEEDDPMQDGADICPTCRNVGIRKALELTMRELEEYLLRDAQYRASHVTDLL